MPQEIDAEKRRIEESRKGTKNWRRWGPYLSERQWGTVREDYSADGTAWDYFPHDHARSRAYRWGEDGIAGFSDDRQLLCLSLALWNGRDPILKERLFGLTNQQGNHGEDVKELYYYLDAVPSHAYNRMLYKLLQAAYPYQRLIDENADRKGSSQREFELIDTGLFDEDRYFDVEVEYAKVAPDDILMRITVHKSRTGDRTDPHSATGLVPQHLELVRRLLSTRDERANSRNRSRQSRRHRPLHAWLRGAGSARLLRQRHEFPQGVRKHWATRLLQGRGQRFHRPRTARCH